jgi:hypothetical protein
MPPSWLQVPVQNFATIPQGFFVDFLQVVPDQPNRGEPHASASLAHPTPWAGQVWMPVLLFGDAGYHLAAFARMGGLVAA